jgi:putative PIN family toxin of toxin-antitoxin system
MSNSINRIVVDTNIWISLLIKKDYVKIDKLLSQNKVMLLFSDELLSEFLSVIGRPKFIKYFSPSDIDFVFGIIKEYSQFITVSSIISACRDVKDNFLLSLSVDGNADYLITGIVTMPQFLAIES